MRIGWALVVAVASSGCSKSIGDLPATVPYKMSVNDRDLVQVLEGRTVVVDGSPVGKFQRALDGGGVVVEFEYRPILDGSTPAHGVLVETPCGPESIPLGGSVAVRSADETAALLEAGHAIPLVVSLRHTPDEFRPATTRVYVARGSAKAEVRVGETVLPASDGAVEMTTGTCADAPVSIGGKEVGRWTAGQVLFVDLDEAHCYAYQQRAYSLSGFDGRGDEDEVLSEGANLLPAPRAVIDHYLEPYPQSVEVVGGEHIVLSRIFETDCAAAG